MADQQHLAVLKQGVTAWNVWRRQHPEILPDLNEADLSDADLSGADLRHANLMRGLERDLWKYGVVIAGMLFLLMLMAWIPTPVAHASGKLPGFAKAGTATVQATPTVDATVTALQKEQLAQQVAQQQHSWGNWFWGNSATIFSSFLSTLVIVIGALVGLWRWRRDRRDAQDKELQDRHSEREKRAEERFQAAVIGLGEDKEGAKVGAAILLRTFLHPGYEQFYTQVFDLAVAHLRLPRTPHPPKDPYIAIPLTPLRQALIVVFKEAFPLARSQQQLDPQSLDATGIQLDTAYLNRADLRQIWMPQAVLRKANLENADLSGANLEGADLSGANLYNANLNDANLSGAALDKINPMKATFAKANLSRAVFTEVMLDNAMLEGANLREANLRGVSLKNAFLWGADLSGADLYGAVLIKANLVRANLAGASLHLVVLEGANLAGVDLSDADLSNIRSWKDTNLKGAKGLTKEQLEYCKAKGAFVDEDMTINLPQPTVAASSSSLNNHALASSVPPTQGSISPNASENSAVSPQQDLASGVSPNT